MPTDAESFHKLRELYLSTEFPLSHRLVWIAAALFLFFYVLRLVRRRVLREEYTPIWFVASLGFSFYARFFGSYNATYGALAGIVVLLLWLLISFAVVILGAEINAALERQTRIAASTSSGSDDDAVPRAETVTDNLPREPWRAPEQTPTTPK